MEKQSKLTPAVLNTLCKVPRSHTPERFRVLLRVLEQLDDALTVVVRNTRACRTDRDSFVIYHESGLVAHRLCFPCTRANMLQGRRGDERASERDEKV